MRDNYDLWARHDEEREAKREELPRCSVCDEHIMDDYAYVINDEIICGDCLNAYYLKRVEDI